MTGQYRYTLTRDLVGVPHATSRQMLFVMLNPSTADQNTDDPTIRRCMKFAAREGCSILAVVNLYAYRATKPADLVAAAAAGIDVIGPDNRATCREAIARADVIVAAWGAHPMAAAREVDLTWQVLTAGRQLHCLGLTQAGQPRHPLYVRTDQPLEVYAQ